MCRGPCEQQAAISISNFVKSHFKALGFNTVKSHVKALGVLGGLISRHAYFPGGRGGGIEQNKKNVTERRDKKYLRNELKLSYHYI